MKRLRNVPVLVLIALVHFALAHPVLPTPAYAAADSEGAAHLQKILTAWLDQHESEFWIGGYTLRREGPLTVDPAGKYYAVTMPHLALHDPEGGYLDIGILAINAMPGGQAGEWRMTIAVPTPLISYDAEKKIRTRINIGRQTLAGLWSEEMQHFMKLDARYENVDIQRVQHGTHITIPRTSAVFDFSPSKDGKLWSGPVKYLLEDLSVHNNGKKKIAHIGKLEIDGFTYDFDPRAAKAYRDKVATMLKSAGTAPATDENLQDHFNLSLDSLLSMANGADFSITARDVMLSPPAKGEAPEQQIRADQIGISSQVRDLRTKSTSFSLTSFYQGVAMTPLPPSGGETFPERAKISLSLDKIPFRDILRMTRSPVTPAAATPLSEASQRMTVALQMMTESGTTLSVKDTSIGNPLYNVLINGNFLTDATAKMKATGNVTFKISGLNILAATAKRKLSDKSLDAATRKGLQDTLMGATLLQTLGQAEKSGSGSDTRDYVFDLAPNGKLTMNGVDISVIREMIELRRNAQNDPEKSAE